MSLTRMTVIASKMLARNWPRCWMRMRCVMRYYWFLYLADLAVGSPPMSFLIEPTKPTARLSPPNKNAGKKSSSKSRFQMVAMVIPFWSFLRMHMNCLYSKWGLSGFKVLIVCMSVYIYIYCVYLFLYLQAKISQIQCIMNSLILYWCYINMFWFWFNSQLVFTSYSLFFCFWGLVCKFKDVPGKKCGFYHFIHSFIYRTSLRILFQILCFDLYIYIHIYSSYSSQYDDTSQATWQW